jgi:hypothetical protein
MCLLWRTNWVSYIPEDAILHSHRRENLKSYNGRDYGKQRLGDVQTGFHYLLAIFQLVGVIMFK